ncbi:hypothetical protein AB6A40_006602 [Gnathostoma spinigerum]|uniref:Uncharacterized protein n=1 Tax=Gnathostoma spinigerum TaxID=75299 RepID=A0ABD6EJ22_9BILA
MPLILPGSLHPSNKNAICWSEKGLLAYGCHCTLIVVDVLKKKVLQTLEKHCSAVNQVLWAAEDETKQASDLRVLCASSDVSGCIVVWNVLKGSVVSSFRNNSSAVIVYFWLEIQHWERTESLETPVKRYICKRG